MVCSGGASRDPASGTMPAARRSWIASARHAGLRRGAAGPDEALCCPNMPDLHTTDHAHVWSRHWSSGTPHSCAGSYGAVYGGAIAAFWRGVHASTPSGATVLDLATGNGAIPRLLLDLRPTLDCQLVGVDVATPSAGWRAAMTPAAARRLSLRAGVAVESLPFDDASFDLVTSQYGIEYGEVDAALAQALRVCAPGGRLVFVLHHAASRPVQLAKTELDHLTWLVGDAGLVTAAEGLIAPMARSATPAGRASLTGDVVAHAARERFNAAQAALRDRARVIDGADVLAEVQDAVNAVIGTAVQRGEAEARRAWAHLRAQLDDARFRLTALRRCALDDAAIAHWVATLGAGGRPVAVDTLVDGAHLLGWTVIAGTTAHP
jgi:SAM-dependent methyltransferase